ncbi:LysR family transcriptional regulator [uncultured Shimia sp.]|uniref:LysR family transcriptional regulator n=1 Tax=uncultured Shimia sp. TaxID=573152 RepID=UPI00262C335F|nr:LysR family transcriptional regulator [uncultured Shimia sp.]
MITTKDQADWAKLRAFLATAEAGSLSGAARALGMTQPTIGRQVAALEQELGILLFERVGRRLQLTQTGAELLEHARQMGEAAGQISLMAAGLSQSIEGRVKITASDVMSTYGLAGFLSQLREQAPKLEIEIVASDDIKDILRRDADIAIRHVRPEQPDLIARLIQESTGHYYASKDYLARRGAPQSIADLAAHDFISFGDPDQMLAYLTPLGLPIDRRNFRLGCSNGVAAWEYVRQGFGIGVMDDRIASAFPDVQKVLPDVDPFTYPVWLTTHRELHTSRRIRLVWDLLADYLSAR